MRDPCKLIRSGIADAIAGRLDGVHFNGGEIGKDVRYRFKLRPVVLDVLARGEVRVAAIIFAGDVCKQAQLPRGK